MEEEKRELEEHRRRQLKEASLKKVVAGKVAASDNSQSLKDVNAKKIKEYRYLRLSDTAGALVTKGVVIIHNRGSGSNKKSTHSTHRVGQFLPLGEKKTEKTMGKTGLEKIVSSTQKWKKLLLACENYFWLGKKWKTGRNS